jgi:hypothetical protein
MIIITLSPQKIAGQILVSDIPVVTAYPFLTADFAELWANV